MAVRVKWFCLLAEACPEHPNRLVAEMGKPRDAPHSQGNPRSTLRRLFSFVN
jgi:hypothetical protein